VLAVDRDGAARALYRRGSLGEGDYRLALQQPDQPGVIIAGQTTEARVWICRDREQPEQVLGGPAEGFGLITPGDQKAPAVLDTLLPTGNRNQLRAPTFESGECTR
jgi:hypothetical protein